MEKLKEKTKELEKGSRKEKGKNKKTKVKIIVVSTSVIVVLLLFSTVFGITAMTNSKIMSGISIDNVDVSGLTKEQAIDKISKELEERQKQTIKLKYQDFEKELPLEQLEITSNAEESVEKAVECGRDSNIFVNNINVIKSKFTKQNIDLEINVNEEALDKFIDETGNELPGLAQDYSYSIDETDLIIAKGVDGIAIDKENIKNTIENQVKDLSQKIDNEIEIPVVEAKAGEIDIEKIHEEIYSEPQNAYMIEEPFQVVADKDGIDFAISIDEAKALLLEDKEEYIIPLKITKASVTIASFGSKAFPNRLATFSTNYAASNKGRTTNLSIACKKINGYVLQPGETFSYNKVLGKRTVENGYKEAAIFTTNGVENGLGGGICQISSTLYNSVLMANLDIVERHNHSYVTSYLKPGLDATVSYGSQDFKFKNTRKYPIQIKASIGGGVATVSIYGKYEETEYNVKISAVTTETIPFETQTIEDPSLPAGKQVVEKNGSTGYKSVTYKEVYTKSGSLVSKTQISSDRYKTITKIVRVGTGGAEPAPAPSTTPTQPPVQSPEPSPTTPQPSTTPSPVPSEEPTPSPDPNGTSGE